MILDNEINLILPETERESSTEIKLGYFKGSLVVDSENFDYLEFSDIQVIYDYMKINLDKAIEI